MHSCSTGSIRVTETIKIRQLQRQTKQIMKISRKFKRGLVFACTTLSIIIFLRELYSDEEDALPSAEEPSFAPRHENSLFFVETSYNGKLTARKACAVEAAARAHPMREIYVLFSAPVTGNKLQTTCLAKLLRFPNVKLLRVHIAEFSKGTAVQSILLKLKKSRFSIQHTADILRILTLNKWGGVSLDTEMIVMRPLDKLSNLNWIVQQDGNFVAPGLFSFGKDVVGSNLTGSILAEILKTYNPNDRSITGSSVIKKVVQRMCPIRIRWDACNGIGIYSHKLFYCTKKIHINEFNKITTRQGYYSFQWDFRSTRRSKTEIYLPKEQLAKKFCPSIYWSHPEELLDV